jgi:hypothetical protein
MWMSKRWWVTAWLSDDISPFLLSPSPHKETFAPLPVREATTWGGGRIALHRQHGVVSRSMYVITTGGILTQWGIRTNEKKKSKVCERRWAYFERFECTIIQMSAVDSLYAHPTWNTVHKPIANIESTLLQSSHMTLSHVSGGFRKSPSRFIWNSKTWREKI